MCILMSREQEMACLACKALDEKKGMDIKVIDIHEVSVIADYFIDQQDKILYLDADIACQGNLKPLITMDLANNVAAVVNERNIFNYLFPYFLWLLYHIICGLSRLFSISIANFLI